MECSSLLPNPKVKGYKNPFLLFLLCTPAWPTLLMCTFLHCAPFLCLYTKKGIVSFVICILFSNRVCRYKYFQMVFIACLLPNHLRKFDIREESCYDLFNPCSFKKENKKNLLQLEDTCKCAVNNNTVYRP